MILSRRRVADERSSPDRSGRSQRGWTAIEVVVVLGLLAVLLASVTSVLISQQRFYTRNADIAATRGASRLAAELLVAELRGVCAADGGLYGFASDSVAIRSTTGIGIVCGVSVSALVVRRVSGVFADLPADSILVFVEHGTGVAHDDQLRVARIEESRAASSPACPDGAPPDLKLVLDRELLGVAIGSPVRSFRPYVYRLYMGGDGQWWLGQRLRNGRIQPVVGPFTAPDEGGLRFAFVDAAGAPTDDPTSVARVGISLIARGRVQYPWRGVKRIFSDSVTTAVWLRGF